MKQRTLYLSCNSLEPSYLESVPAFASVRVEMRRQHPGPLCEALTFQMSGLTNPQAVRPTRPCQHPSTPRPRATLILTSG